MQNSVSPRKISISDYQKQFHCAVFVILKQNFFQKYRDMLKHVIGVMVSRNNQKNF